MLISLILTLFLLLHLLKMMNSWFHRCLHIPCNQYMLNSNCQYMMYILYMKNNKFLNNSLYMFLNIQYMMSIQYTLWNMLHYMMYSYLYMMYIQNNY